VGLTNTRKAAMLLANLDPRTAAELLKAPRPDLLAEITAELMLMESAGPRAPAHEPFRDFAKVLLRKGTREARPETFIDNLLETAVGKQRSEEVLTQARRIIDSRDPFMPVRPMDVRLIARAIEGEHPQVAAMVLMELPPQRSAALIPLLEEKVRGEAIKRMILGDAVSVEAKMRVAAMIRERLEKIRKTDAQTAGDVVSAAIVGGASAEPVAQASANLRRVALLLRGLATELRDSLIKAIATQNTETASAVQNLMIVWEDLPLVSERNLQEALRNTDARKLALAIHNTAQAVKARILANISERTRGMIEEETQLMKKPKAEDIEPAREEILTSLRKMNAAGELQFEES
jgi:flagellar motor switch protein FliG